MLVHQWLFIGIFVLERGQCIDPIVAICSYTVLANKRLLHMSVPYLYLLSFDVLLSCPLVYLYIYLL